MPTGYTCIIEEKEGVTFRDYALRCARAFCGHQREESLDAMPEPRKLDPYHLKEMKKAEAELKELLCLSEEGLMALWQSEKESREERDAQVLRKRNRERSAYAKIRADVVMWVPPTPAHENLKKFMLEQIDLCYEPNEQPYRSPPMPEPRKYLADLVEVQTENIAYHAKRYTQEIEYVASSKAWIETLLASLPEVSP